MELISIFGEVQAALPKRSLKKLKAQLYLLGGNVYSNCSFVTQRTQKLQENVHEHRCQFFSKVWCAELEVKKSEGKKMMHHTSLQSWLVFVCLFPALFLWLFHSIDPCFFVWCTAARNSDSVISLPSRGALAAGVSLSPWRCRRWSPQKRKTNELYLSCTCLHLLPINSSPICHRHCATKVSFLCTVQEQSKMWEVHKAEWRNEMAFLELKLDWGGRKQNSLLEKKK